MKILVNNQIDEKAWKVFAEANSFKNPFQTKSFFDLANSVNGMEGTAYAVEENGSLIDLCVAVYHKEAGIKGYFSGRAIIYGGPILTENKNAAEFLIKYVTADLKKAIYIETRNFKNYSDFRKVFENSGWEYVPYLNFRLNCSGEEVVWKNLNTNRQRQIKKALKLGVAATEAQTEEDVRQFYQVLEVLYNQKVKKPFFSLAFFQEFLKSGVGKIFLIKFEGKVIGGIACPILQGEAIYELYVCGLDQEYKDCSPSVMATYAAIEYGIKNGIKYFDFMGAGKPDEDYGVREFKAKFGGEMVEHGRFIKINKVFLYNLGKAIINVISKRKA